MTRRRSFEYFHIELEEHALLIANGAPAESYRNDGNRSSFDWGLGVSDARRSPCAPIYVQGPIVDTVWQRLAERAGADVDTHTLTDDPDLHLMVGGTRIDATANDGDTYLFELDASGPEIRLAWRHVVPAEVGSCRDQRRLGVAVRRCWFEDGAARREIDFDSPLLRTGFHAPEWQAGFRWSDGLGLLPQVGAHHKHRIVVGVEIGCRAQYRPAA